MLALALMFCVTTGSRDNWQSTWMATCKDSRDISECTDKALDDNQHEIYTKWLMHVDDTIEHLQIESLLLRHQDLVSFASQVIQHVSDRVHTVGQKHNQLSLFLTEKDSELQMVAAQLVRDYYNNVSFIGMKFE